MSTAEEVVVVAYLINQQLQETTVVTEAWLVCWMMQCAMDKLSLLVS